MGATVLLATAATGCYQPGMVGYSTTPVVAQVDAQVAAPAPVVTAQVSAPAPVMDVQVAPMVATPDLITISPDVQVIADYHEPIFFTGGFYWRETDRGWFRSTSYDRGWAYQRDAPYRVRNIENRGTYRNYRPSGYTPRNNYANRGYDRPARTWNNRGGYDRPANAGYQPRPRYGNSGGGYDRPNNTGYNQPRNAGYQPRPRYGNSGGGYDRPNNTGYNQPRNAGYNAQPRNTGWRNTGYNAQPRNTGYNAQPRNTGYNAPRNTGYNARPRNTGYNAQPRYGGGNSNYKPSARPARSSQPARSYSGGGRRSRR